MHTWRGGKSFAAQRAYVKHVWPEVHDQISGRIEEIESFMDSVSGETSVCLDYEKPVSNRVVYCNNINDFHVQQHYYPFLASLARGGNLGNLKIFEYSGAEGHAPPSPEQFFGGMKVGLEWLLGGSEVRVH